jgi:hypothetical protein
MGAARDPAGKGSAAGSFDRRLSRRALLVQGTILTAVLTPLPGVLRRAGLLEDALAAPPDVVLETFNGLVAFVVPGPDPYSAAQGESRPEPGGIAAGAAPALVVGLNFAQWFNPTAAEAVATLLNGVALGVNPGAASGSFASAFANLSFAEKAIVFSVLDGDPQFEPLRPLTGTLLAIVGFLSYSEVGVFDPATRTLDAQPVGWAISSYDGVAEGRDELRGYFENRRRVRDA